MSLTKEAKTQIVDAFQRTAGDTGSTEVQVALLTHRIRQLTEHLKVHKKDVSCRVRGLKRMVEQRRKLLTYFKRTKPSAYAALVQELGLRG